MKLKRKYRIVLRPTFFGNKLPVEKRYSLHLYSAKSFFIKYYAYLPFIYSLKHIKFSNNSKILDIGCADGPFLPTLNHYANFIIANDIDGDRVRDAKNLVDFKLNKSKKINLLCSDGEKLPFKTNFFDIIFCFEVMEHVVVPDQFLREIIRVLNKNGVFICTLPIETGPSLLVRNVIGKIAKFRRPHYTRKELFQRIFLKKGGREFEGQIGHKNFDWRLIEKNIKLHFKVLKMKFIPLNFLRDINPLILIKAIKK